VQPRTSRSGGIALRERRVVGEPDDEHLVKIDTETTEPAVLAGMVETLRRWRPTIICEVLPGHEVERPLMDILQPLGYVFYHLRPEGPVSTERVAGHPELLNYAFAPDAAAFERAASFVPSGTRNLR
jgi:hypothetical protein